MEPKSVSKYELLEQIGEGSFGKVRKVKRIKDGKILVWKELNYQRMSQKEREQLVNEVNILHELRHPFIVRFVDRVVDNRAGRLYLVMEYCSGGDLATRIAHHRHHKRRFSESEIWRLASQLVLALKKCHTHRPQPILHRDIKPANVLFDERGNAKLGDFGLARRLAPRDFARTTAGTPYYMAPEIVNGWQYNELSDIWSLGCVLYEMAALRPPFDATTEADLWRLITAGSFAPLPTRYFSADLTSLIRDMLQVVSSKRSNLEELEKVSELRLYLREDKIAVKEYMLYTSYAKKSKELELWEARLKRKQQDLDALAETLQDVQNNSERPSKRQSSNPQEVKKSLDRPTVRLERPISDHYLYKGKENHHNGEKGPNQLSHNHRLITGKLLKRAKELNL